jgi:hypothetical protein
VVCASLICVPQPQIWSRLSSPVAPHMRARAKSRLLVASASGAFPRATWEAGPASQAEGRSSTAPRVSHGGRWEKERARDWLQSSVSAGPPSWRHELPANGVAPRPRRVHSAFIANAGGTALVPVSMPSAADSSRTRLDLLGSLSPTHTAVLMCSHPRKQEELWSLLYSTCYLLHIGYLVDV